MIANYARFLLAKLQLESLTGKRSPKAIRAALTKLSTGSGAYDKAYDEAMERIHGQLEDQENLAKDALSWIVCSRRPLQTVELQHALAIEQGTEHLDEDNITAIEDIVSVCAGLVTVDEESRIIRLVHYTTQEYFERNKSRWLPDAERSLTLSCITYLSFNSLKQPCDKFKDLLNREEENPFFSYALKNWGHHARNIQGVSEEVVTFLRCDQSQFGNLSPNKYPRDIYTWESSFLEPNPTGLHHLAQVGDLKHFAAFIDATQDFVSI